MADYEKLLKLRPEHAVKNLGAKSKVCLLSSRDIFRVLRKDKMIVMACNARIIHNIPGLMRAAKELDAVIGFEMAKSESDLSGGYTGFTPQLYFNAIIEWAEKEKFYLPFFIHADHTTVKDTSEAAIKSARDLNAEQLRVGFTSFSIDASFNPLPDNIRITTQLAKPLMEFNVGLEVEVGEILSLKKGGHISTVEEGVEMVDGVQAAGIKPNLLAINNGAIHGNYKPGEDVHIDLKRTGEIYEAIKGKGVDIAQHGITGTPLNLVGQFADYGIRKGNVATQWQNIVHELLPKDLEDAIQAWCKKENKDLKSATKPFKKEIDSIPKEYSEKIVGKTEEVAKEFILAFRAKGSAALVASRLLA